MIQNSKTVWNHLPSYAGIQDNELRSTLDQHNNLLTTLHGVNSKWCDLCCRWWCYVSSSAKLTTSNCEKCHKNVWC